MKDLNESFDKRFGNYPQFGLEKDEVLTFIHQREKELLARVIKIVKSVGLHIKTEKYQGQRVYKLKEFEHLIKKELSNE